MSATTVPVASAGPELVRLSHHTVECQTWSQVHEAAKPGELPCIASYCEEGQQLWLIALREGMATRRARKAGAA